MMRVGRAEGAAGGASVDRSNGGVCAVAAADVAGAMAAAGAAGIGIATGGAGGIDIAWAGAVPARGVRRVVAATPRVSGT